MHENFSRRDNAEFASAFEALLPAFCFQLVAL